VPAITHLRGPAAAYRRSGLLSGFAHPPVAG
jgi:hypothetical protein